MTGLLVDGNGPVFLILGTTLGPQQQQLLGVATAAATFGIIISAGNLFFTVASGITTGDNKKQQLVLVLLLWVLWMLVQFDAGVLLLLHITRVWVTGGVCLWMGSKCLGFLFFSSTITFPL